MTLHRTPTNSASRLFARSNSLESGCTNAVNIRARKKRERKRTKSCRGRNRSWTRCCTAVLCRGAARKIHQKACNFCASFRTYQIFLHASRASDAEVDPVNEGHGIQKTKERKHSPVDHPSIAPSKGVSHNSRLNRSSEHLHRLLYKYGVIVRIESRLLD